MTETPAERPGRRRRHPGRAVLVSTAVLAVMAAACSSSSNTTATPSTSGATGSTPTGGPGTTTGGGGYAVFNGQGNNLDAYVPTPPFTTQRVISTVADKPDGLDINAQICFFPDGSNRFIAGEDTGQSKGDLQGWGIFELSGEAVGQFQATQVAKLVPTYQNAADNAENYGCGFLSDGRVLTTDVGNQALGAGDGQLIVWFPPFDSEKVRFCKLDIGIATAQSILVDGQDNVYVASSRAPTGGVWKYSPPFPTSNDAAGGCGTTDGTGAPQATDVKKELVIPQDDKLFSPAGLAPAPDGGMYVSSVFTGVINQYDASYRLVQTVLEPPAGEKVGPTPVSTGTPLGIGAGPDGTLYYADIGLTAEPGELPGPGNKTGSVRRITFTGGKPNPPEVMASGLAFPDGIGIWVP